MRYTGPLSTIQSLDRSLKGLTQHRPPRAEIAHDGEALSNAVWGYYDTKPLVFTRKYLLYLATGPRDVVPKASLTLRFDLRQKSGHICCSRQDLPVLKAHLGRLLPEFNDTINSLSEVHLVEPAFNNGTEFHRSRVHA